MCLTDVLEAGGHYGIHGIHSEALRETWFALASHSMIRLVRANHNIGRQRQRTDTLPRVFRMIRIIKIVAVDPNAGTCSESHKHVKSKKATYISCTNKVVLFVVPLSYVLACLRWNLDNQGGISWSDQLKHKSTKVVSQYSVNSHWALTMFSGSLDKITPTSSEEHLYFV